MTSHSPSRTTSAPRSTGRPRAAPWHLGSSWQLGSNGSGSCTTRARGMRWFEREGMRWFEALFEHQEAAAVPPACEPMHCALRELDGHRRPRPDGRAALQGERKTKLSSLFVDENDATAYSIDDAEFSQVLEQELVSADRDADSHCLRSDSIWGVHRDSGSRHGLQDSAPGRTLLRDSPEPSTSDGERRFRSTKDVAASTCSSIRPSASNRSISSRSTRRPGYARKQIPTARASCGYSFHR